MRALLCLLLLATACDGSTDPLADAGLDPDAALAEVDASGIPQDSDGGNTGGDPGQTTDAGGNDIVTYPDGGVPAGPTGCPAGTHCGFVYRTYGNHRYDCEQCRYFAWALGVSAACDNSGNSCVQNQVCAGGVCQSIDTWIICAGDDGTVCGNKCCLSAYWNGGQAACDCR